jgi:hypothetical protein
MPSPQINLDLNATVQQPFAPSSAGSAPNRDKDNYLVNDIKDPTPCTLMYVKGRASRTIKIANAIVMPSRIHHGWPIPSECAVVDVTTIREGYEFEDLDYSDEDEGIEKLVDAKGTFIHRRLFHHGAQRTRHAKACSNLSSISGSSSHSKCSRPSKRVSSPKAPRQ